MTRENSAPSPRRLSMRTGDGGFSSKVKRGGAPASPACVDGPMRAAAPHPFLRRIRVFLPFFLRRRPGAPRRSPLSPSGERTAAPRSGPCPRGARPSPAGRTRASGRGRRSRAGRGGRRSRPSSRRESAGGRPCEPLRERGGSPRTRRRAGGRRPSRRGSPGPAGTPRRCRRRRDRRRHARPRLPLGAGPRGLDDARPLVAERERERDLRMAAPGDLEVRPARERRADADENLAGPARGHRHVPEHGRSGSFADERAHGRSVAGTRVRPRRGAPTSLDGGRRRTQSRAA